MDTRLLLMLLTIFSAVLTIAGEELECIKCQPIWPMRDFNEEKFLGLWYQTRWYLITVPGVNVSIDHWSFNFFYYKKPEDKSTLYSDVTYRQKDASYCDPTVTTVMNEIRSGQYWTSKGAFTENFTTTILYTDYDSFAVTHECLEDLERDCTNGKVAFWSRTQEMSISDVKKGDMVAKKICHFDMNRFIDVEHGVDCAPPKHEKCKDKKSEKKKKKCSNEKMIKTGREQCLNR